MDSRNITENTFNSTCNDNKNNLSLTMTAEDALEFNTL